MVDSEDPTSARQNNFSLFARTYMQLCISFVFWKNRSHYIIERKYVHSYIELNGFPYKFTNTYVETA